MATESKLPVAVIEARQKLLEGRVKLRAQHDAGSPGLQVCAKLTDLLDSVVLDLANVATSHAGNLSGQVDANFCLVAHGGYGRRDVAPHSDVDLMLLHTPEVADEAVTVARLLSQWVVDAGCQLGFSLRTPHQACKLAWEDATVFTSLAESRFLTGSVDLFTQYMRTLRQGAKRRSKRIIRAVAKARRQERSKYGETVFLLEPNVKRSPGGLRDVQLIRWIGFARFGECDLEQLAQLGHISQEDFQLVRRGYHYLLRLRNQMHFAASKSQDQLDRGLQIQLTEWSGFEGAEGILPVEQFMQQYFEHTSQIRYCSAHFVSNAEWQSPLSKTIERSLGIPVGRDFRAGFRHVWATKNGLERVKRDPAAVLELMSISSRFGKPIQHHTWREIRDSMRNRKLGEIDPLTIERFLELMSRTNDLAGRLQRLHELRVLEKIIPDMAHARCLLQFNQYHKYTVDAHSIQAIEKVTELESDRSQLGTLYRGLKNKMILHLALLLHDLGKGFPEDHSEVGKVIAEKTANRLRLSALDRETLSFLVHKHLLLTHTAFRFDLSDEKAAVEFAAVVGSSERLQLLLLLSYADLASVGPDVISQWKIDLLLQLYYQTDRHFRDSNPNSQVHREVESQRDSLIRSAPRGADKDWWARQVQALPVSYVLRSNISTLANELADLQQLKAKPCVAWGHYLEQQNAVEYLVASKQHDVPIGTFHRITGALTSQNHQIITAEIHTQPDSIALDRFLVEDLEFDGPPPEGRIEEVCAKIYDALDPENYRPPTFPKKWASSAKRRGEGLEIQPTQVRFDNSTSESHTIITLFAYDRRGLLYAISRALFEMQLILHSAKISTHLDQVVDVFYVADLEGNKITESTRLYMIRQRLLQAVDGFQNG